MNSANLVKAIEAAKKCSPDGSALELYLAHAVLELQKRLNAEREAYNNLRDEIKLSKRDLL
jgi:hypothetical protein